MIYPKPIMRLTELEKMGFPRESLLKAFRSPGQTFAWKNDPYKINSPVLFDVDGFETWRKKQARASVGGSR